MFESVSFTSEGDVLCYPRFNRVFVSVSVVAHAGWIISVDIESSDEEADAVDVSGDVPPPWFTGSIFLLLCTVYLCSLIVVPAGTDAVVHEAPLRLQPSSDERRRLVTLSVDLRRAWRSCRQG